MTTAVDLEESVLVEMVREFIDRDVKRTVREVEHAGEYPEAWTGQPVPETLCLNGERPRSLKDVGACSGVVGGRAIVARELGIPCVMNTGCGTTALRTETGEGAGFFE